MTGFAISPDGKTIASGSQDQTIRLWDAQTGKQLKILAEGDIAEHLMFRPDGKQLLASTFNGIKAWDLATDELQRTVKVPLRFKTFNREGTQAVCAVSDRGGLGPGVCKIFDTRTGEILKEFKGHTSPVSVIAFNQDEKLLLSGGWNGVIKIWDIENNKELRSIQAHTFLVEAIVMHPDGKRFATSSRDKTLKLWDLETGEELKTFPGDGDTSGTLAFHPNGKQLAGAGMDKKITIWDVETGKTQFELVGHDQGVLELMYTPSGQHIITSSTDHTIKIWPSDRDQNLRTLEGKEGRIDTLEFTPDGKRLVRGGGSYTDHAEPGDVKIWEIESGKALDVHKGFGRLIAVAPDGKRVVSGGFGGWTKVWDIESGEMLVRLPDRHKHLKSFGFSPTSPVVDVSCCGVTVGSSIFSLHFGSVYFFGR